MSRFEALRLTFAQVGPGMPAASTLWQMICTSHTRSRVTQLGAVSARTKAKDGILGVSDVAQT